MIQTKGPMVIALVVFSLLLAGTVHSTCPTGWKLRRGICYGFSQGRLTWAEALGICRNYSATLAEPRNARDNRWLKHQVRRRKLRSAWIGVSDLFKSGRFEYISDETEITIRPFSPRNPSNSDGVEHCVHYWSSRGYEWNDARCYRSLAFVCQRFYVFV